MPPDSHVDSRDDFLPPYAIVRLGSSRFLHTKEVCSIAYSRDGTRIVSVEEDHATVRIWDASSGILIREIRIPGIFSRESFVSEDTIVAFPPDGNSIAAGVAGQVCFWDVNSGNVTRRYSGHCKGILALTFSCDANTFYCGDADNKLHLWHIASGKRLRTWNYFKGHQPSLLAGGLPERTATLKAISPNGKTAVWLVEHWTDDGAGISRVDGKLVIWDVKAEADICCVADNTDSDYSSASIALSPDGQFLLVATPDTDVTVWNADTGQRFNLKGHLGSIDAVTFAPDSRRAAVLARNSSNTLSIWDIVARKEIWRRQVSPRDAPGWNKSLAFSPDGEKLAVGNWKTICVLDVQTANQTPYIRCNRWPVCFLKFSANGRTLISADMTSVCNWDVPSHSSSPISLVHHNADSESIGVSYDANTKIRQPLGGAFQLRELSSNKLLYESVEKAEVFSRAVFSLDGSAAVLIGGSKDTELAFLNLASRRIRSTMTVDRLIGDSLVLSNDGRFLAASTCNHAVVIVDTTKREIIQRFATPNDPRSHNEPQFSLSNGAFSPDGQLLVLGTTLDFNDDSNTSNEVLPHCFPRIRVWNVASGRELRQFERWLPSLPGGKITSIQFSRDNKNLAIALSCGPTGLAGPEHAFVDIIEVASGAIRRRFQGHTDSITSIAFSADNNLFATGSADTSILLWDMKNAAKLTEISNQNSSQALHFYWQRIGERDAKSAFDAILALVAIPDQSVSFLAGQVSRLERGSEEEIHRIIAELDADSYNTREAATARLAALGEIARAALKQALSGKLSLETRRRIDCLISELDEMDYSPARLQEIRSIEVLERIGNERARDLLKDFARGPSEGLRTIEAKASLARLHSAH